MEWSRLVETLRDTVISVASMSPVEATFVIGLLAAAIAVWGVATQRQIARRRATFDHISKTEADADFIKARRTFIALARQEGGLAPWAEEDKQNSEECQLLRLVLNDFELVSIGIQRNIIDEEFYKRWYKSGVIKNWQYASPLIARLRERTGNQNLFHEFEQMYNWFRDDKPPDRVRGWLSRHL
jgi:Domain of unknown function (DUF4760)